jgi:HD-GYP domain-containing protein (c-di-GMP phosphodiesterase class II)
MDLFASQSAYVIDTTTKMQSADAFFSELQDSYLASWMKALDLRDGETERHTKRVTQMTVRLAKRLKLPIDEIEQIEQGAMLHDIGKIGIPDRVLNKPGMFTAEEREIMSRHPQYAYDLISKIPFLVSAVDIPYCHHEKWDGTGYPRGLRGIEIPLSARIFAVVDVYDALTTDRPYRDAWPVKKTIDFILEQAGLHFDPDIVPVFIDMMQGKK